MILDVNALYGFRKAKETNPIYGQVLDTDQLAAALVAPAR